MVHPVIPLREVKSYRPTLFHSSYQKYERDLKRYLERGWRLVSCTVAGRDLFTRLWLTATYEESTKEHKESVPSHLFAQKQ